MGLKTTFEQIAVYFDKNVFQEETNRSPPINYDRINK